MVTAPTAGPRGGGAIYRFERAELDPARCELRVDGEAVAIEPRIYDLLRLLIEHRDRVLAKEEILDAIWPNVTVNVGVLKRAIWVLRQVLRAAGLSDPITTVPRRGYRFTAAVTRGEAPPEPPAAGPEARAPEPEAPPPTLRGRAVEWAQLTEALASAREGRGRLLLLRGEPGVGKTFLAEAACARARRHGARVLVARGHEAGDAPPLWMWIQILREYVDGCDDAGRLRTELGPGAEAVARFLPELYERLPELSPAEEPPAGDGRFAVLDALARFLRNAARSRPTVLLLDDLQWADRSSVELLELLFRRIAASPLLVLGTLRDERLPPEHWLTRFLGAVAHAEDCTWLSIGGLERADVARILGEQAGDTPPPALVDAVHAKTDGNPFFVREIGRLLGRAEPGSSHAAGDGSFRVPERLRDAVLRRVTALPPPARAALVAASVLGHDVDARVLPRVMETEGQAVLDALDAAVSARLLDDRGEHRFRFAHALVHEVVYATMPRAERARRHRAAARALERLAAPGEALDEIARHYYEAVDCGTWPEALRWARAAGDAAMRRLGYERAEAQYERALELVRVHDPEAHVVAAELLTARGHAQRAQGLPAPVVKSSYRRAAELAERSADSDDARSVFAEAALGYTGHGAIADPYARYLPTVDPLRVELLERAAVKVPPDSTLELRVRCRLAQELDGRQPERREALLRRAEAIAAQQEDPRLRAAALTARCVVLGDEAERWHERIDAGREALQLARARGDVPLETNVRAMLAAEAIAAADWPEAGLQARALTALAEQQRLPMTSATVLSYEGMLAMLQGRFEEAYAFNRRFTAAVGDAFAGGLEFAHGQMLKIRMLDGSIEQMPADEVSSLLRGVRATSTVWCAGFAYWRARRGDLVSARTEFEALVDPREVRLDPNGGRPSSLAYLADVAAALDDTARASVLYRELLPFADHLMVVGSVYCDGAAARPLGRLAALRGDERAMHEHFERALELHRRVHARPFVALTLQQYARALTRLGVDPGRAREMAATARAVADEIGMSLPPDPPGAR